MCAGAPAWAGEGADDFIRAIKQDNRSRMEALLRQGVDPNTRDSRGVPGLYVALQEGALEVAKVILASPRLNPELRTPTDESALMVAALRGQLDIVEALIVKGAQVNKTGWTPLHYAATGGNVEVIGLLLKHGARLEARSPNGSTPLMMAARYGSLEAVQALLRAGADPRLRNETGMDALDYAVSGQRVDAVELLTQFRQRASARRSPPAPTVAEQVTGSSQPPLAPNPIAQPLPPPGQAVQVMHEPPRQAARSMPELPAGQALQVMPAAAASEAASVPARFRLTLPAPGQAEQVLPASRPAEPTAATVSGPAHRITPPAPPAEARW
ncbi:MAG: ankyrin repeat domain-containing protein [Burkholderiaceae bacterium]|nr:ankyrin repeat domain-containing protein [Burkholderiaceae bacterium]